MQSLIITAYKDENRLYNLLDNFYDKFDIYLHIDKESFLDVNKILNKYPKIYVIKKYKISWGSINHLYSIIDLLKIASKKGYNYYHIVSGQDINIKSINQFINFFEKNNKIYLEFISCNNISKKITNRYKRGTFNSSWPINKYKVKFLNFIYGIFRNKNNIGEFSHIYKGLIWSSLTDEAVKYVLNYIECHCDFMDDLLHCLIPEEFFFQTILCNSHLKNKIVNNCLRFNLWYEKYGSTPAILDNDDFDNIKRSDCFFARKVDSNISKELINKIEELINEK